MAMSRLILFFHTTIFSSLIVGCIASPIIAASCPQFFRTYSLWVFGGIGLLILVSWYFYKGACPLTVWENNFRKNEGRATYEGSCIDHYTKRWFRVTLPRHFSSAITLGVLVIPALTMFFI